MAFSLRTLADITVASAGTPEQVSSTDILTTAVLIQADPANAGRIYVGDTFVSSTRGIAIDPGKAFSITSPDLRGITDEISLSDIWIDADQNSDQAKIIYFIRR